MVSKLYRHVFVTGSIHSDLVHGLIRDDAPERALHITGKKRKGLGVQECKQEATKIAFL